VRGTETFEAAANSFLPPVGNWPKAVFLSRPVATDLAVPIGHDAGLAEFLDQHTLVVAEENDAVDEDRSPRMSELPNPFRVPTFGTDHRCAADTRFFRGRELLPTQWSAGFLRAPKSFDLSRWLPPVPDWEPKTDLWVATPVVVSYLADSLRNEYGSAWQIVYSEYYCNLIAAWVRTLQEDKVFVRLDEKTLRHFDVLDTSKLSEAPDGEVACSFYGKMRRAMDVFPWGVVLKDVVRRDRDTGEARKVRVTVDETKEFGFFLRHACVDFDWALTRTRPPMWRRFFRVTSGCGLAVDRRIREGLMPSVANVGVIIARVRHVVIARGRRRRPGPSRPLGRRVPLPPRRLPCSGRRACATCAFARLVGRLCQRWRTPG